MQNTSPPGINIEAEKKRNVRIAIGIGVAGFFGFILLYAVMFLVMFLSPGSFFRLMPMPDFPKAAVDFQGKLFVFSTTIDFQNTNWQQKPRDITVMREFDGKLHEPQEIKPFSSVAADAKAIYFFHDKGYRTFDGRTWSDFESSAIGNSPEGVIDAGRIWVLSRLDGRTQLLRVEGKTAAFVALPFEEKTTPSLFRLDIASVNGMLNLFERESGGVKHYIYTSEGWSEPELLKDVHNYHISTSNGQLWLYSKKAEGPLTERSFDGTSWSEPVSLSFGKGLMGMFYWPMQYEAKRALLLYNPFQSEVYVLDNNGTVSKKFSVGGLMTRHFLSSAIFFGFVPLVLMTLLVFAFSSVINRYKLRRWPVPDGRTYEFASFFRRFLAFTIDMFVLMTPLYILVFFWFKHLLSSPDPLRLAIIFILLMVLFMLVFPFLYFSLFEGLGGKTPGKHLCGIRVLKDDFTRCSIGKAMLRTLLRIVDMFFYSLVAAVTIGATLKWQRVGDLAASTVVVRDRKAASPHSPRGVGPRRP